MQIYQALKTRRQYLTDMFLNMGHVAFAGLVVGQLISNKPFRWSGLGLTILIYFLGFIIKHPKNHD